MSTTPAPGHGGAPTDAPVSDGAPGHGGAQPGAPVFDGAPGHGGAQPGAPVSDGSSSPLIGEEGLPVPGESREGPDLNAPAHAEPVPLQGPPSGEAVDSEARQEEPADLRMGHDIARAMAHLPPDRAAEEIATHLRKFWAARMRRSIVARVEAGEPMDDLLRAGVQLYRQGEIDRAEVEEPSGG